MTVTISNVTELESQEKIILTASEVLSQARVQDAVRPWMMMSQKETH